MLILYHLGGFMMEEIDLTLRICLLGDSAVGKTSLINRYSSDIFGEDQIKIMGSMITKKKVSIDMPEYDKKFNITFSIYDIMGDVNFRELIYQADLHCISGAFLVCDVTRPETLENLIFWVDSLYREIGENIPVIYCANKSDLTGGHMFDLANTEILTEIFCAPWLLTSARTGDNVEEAFRTLGTKIIEHHIRKNGSDISML
jgi:small GTP-binding protein